MKTLRELRAIERERWIKNYEPRLRQQAKQLGISNWETETDLWELLGQVNNAYDELKRPALEERARRLGVPTHKRNWRGKLIPRWYTQLSLDCFAEEDRRKLARQLGEE